MQSILFVLAATLAAVQAAPTTANLETRQDSSAGKTGADVNNGDAACPFEEPFRVRPDDESSFWHNICTSYGAAYANVCAISGTEEERSIGDTVYQLCSEKYPSS